MSETQETNEYTPDPEQQAFDARVSAAWEEIQSYDQQMQEAHPDWPTQPDDPSLRHANAFFDLYLAQRPGYIAQQAVQQAFYMWNNVDDSSRHIDAALAQIGDDAGALFGIIFPAINAYDDDGRKDEVDALVDRLLAMLATDEERSDILYELARNALWNGEHPRARILCERVIAMNASAGAVKRSKSLIHELDNLNIGQMAPVFEATDIDGQPVSLAGLRGKVVLIDFWATWCGPCRGEFPHLRRVHEKFAGERFTMLSISLDEDCDKARKMIEKEKLAWTQVCEGEWSGSQIAQLYNVMGIPSTWLIAPDGRIANKDLREHDLDKAIGELVGGEISS